MLRKTGVVLAKLLGIVLAMALGAYAVAWSANWAAAAYMETIEPAATEATVVPGTPVTVVIEEGSSAARVFDTISAAGVVDRNELETLVRRRNLEGKLRAGTYRLTTGMSAINVVESLLAGPVSAEYAVTIVEGLRTKEILVSLSKQTPYSYDEYYNVLSAGGATSNYLPDRGSLMALEGYGHDPVLVQWEGLLSPDTYQFSQGTPAWQILQTLADTAVDKIDQVEWKELRDAGYSVYDGLIMASLIEAEVRFDEERTLVSGVIHNRLQADMPLGIDATSLYGAQARGRAPTAAELASDEPYNTRITVGLPPSPIAGVRLASLEAAASPAAHTYYYYLIIDEDGHHGFAETLDEFNRMKELAQRSGLF